MTTKGTIPLPFDPEGDYGTTTPPERNCHYWQNQTHYDLDFNAIDFSTGKVIATKAEMEREHNPDYRAPEPKEKPIKPPQHSGEIDLDAFAAGELTNDQAPWPQVQKLVESKYGKKPVSKREAIEIITGQSPA